MYLAIHYRVERARKAAFTLAEVLIAMGLVGVMGVGLYGGLSFGFGQIELTRQEERATQILAERMEVVRLLSWDQLVNFTNYVPTNFVASYSISNPTNPPPGSLMYSGVVQVTAAPMTETYADQVRQVKIILSWTTGNLAHQRDMTTFSSRYGLQNYVY